MPENKLKITDQRTDKTYEIPIENGTIRTMDLRQIKTDDKDFGLMGYDPAFLNTASTKSRLTFIDGEKGILEYRGYPIKELAEQCIFLETAYLLLFGKLPDQNELEDWKKTTKQYSFVHENIRILMETFLFRAHPMGVFISTVAAMGTLYPEAAEVHDPKNRLMQIKRLIAKVPTIAAFSYRHSQGLPYVYPDPDLSYAENFLHMMFGFPNKPANVHPALVKALDMIFILHLDHEQNCGTNAMRSIGSSMVDPYCAMAGAAAALYGPLHGGANEAVLTMLSRIGSKENIPAFIKSVKEGEGRLMGFGHRVYKNFDPRSQILRGMADDVFEVTGRNPLLDVAIELERIALEDDYFVKRKLYPNVDFYSGIIYEAMGIPIPMFPVMFAIPRTVGWLAQWDELLRDKEQKIARPRQVYLGERKLTLKK